jgi:hypothetical protein
MGKVRQKLIDGMNKVELEIFEHNDYLERISSNQKPRELEIQVPVRLNPDFKIYNPPFHGIWVEVKGHIASVNWFPAIAQMPTWLKRRYKVVVVETNTKKRNQMADKLEALGFDYHIHHKGRGYLDNPTLPGEWVLYALELYTNGSNDGNDVDLTKQKRKAKIVVDRFSTMEDSVCGLTNQD